MTVGIALAVTIVGIPISLAIFVAISLWILYRIVRGWLALLEHKPMDIPR